MDLEKVLTLKKPVKKGDEIIDQLTLREPTFGEVQQAEKKPTTNELMMSLIAQVAGIDELFLKKMSFSDYRKAAEIVGNFMNGDQATSES